MDLCFEKSYIRVRELVNQAQASRQAGQLRLAANAYSQAARHLQQTFESLPTTAYVCKKVQRLVKETAALRKLTSGAYSAAGDIPNAGYELSHGARCLEVYTQTLLLQHADFPAVILAQLLDKAADLRTETINLLRGNPDHPASLAFELSYLSKALSFLRQNLPAFRTPEMRERIIGYRAESALLFESRGKLREAYFEYQFLAGLLLEKAKTDPSAFLPAIVAALKAAEICEKAKIDLRFIPTFTGRPQRPAAVWRLRPATSIRFITESKPGNLS